ncbi:GBS Bsp-like repeat-containing protein [Paenibacillus chitinolyticus]|uniref:GBS Bsp-like repeat-containing protein n=1 Tax=Paenibacillus chitinolyticus TaxID=79263 RepID=UPI00367082C5
MRKIIGLTSGLLLSLFLVLLSFPVKTHAIIPLQVIGKEYNTGVIEDHTDKFPNLTNAKTITAYGGYFLALYSNGTVHAKSYYINDAKGNPGGIEDWTWKFPDLTDAISIATDRSYFYVLYRDGTVLCKSYYINDVKGNPYGIQDRTSYFPSTANAKSIALSENYKLTQYNDNSVVAKGALGDENITAYFTDLTNSRAIAYNGRFYYSAMLNVLPALSVDNSDQYVKNDGTSAITLSGTVNDPDNDAITVSATIEGVTKSVTLTNTKTTQNWKLQWGLVSDKIPSRTYTGINVTAKNGEWGTVGTTYNGKIDIEKKPYVLNGSFEDDVNGTNVPDFWENNWRNGNSKNPYANRTPNEEINGKYIYRLNNGTGDASSIQYAASDKISVVGKTSYEVQAFMRHGMKKGATTYVYDASGRINNVILSNGQSQKYQHDENGNLIGKEQAASSGERAEFTILELDAAGTTINEIHKTYTNGDLLWHKNTSSFTAKENTKDVIIRFAIGGREGISLDVDDVKIIQTSQIAAPPKVDFSDPSYEVLVYDIPNGTQKVEFQTWTEQNGKDDLKTVQGKRLADGVWKGIIPFASHSDEAGNYLTDVYADGNLLGQSATMVGPSAAVVRAPSDVNITAGSYEIVVDGVSDQVNKVLFPTWSENNGQDDLENPWPEGTKVSAHTWKITVPFDKHNNDTGNYITHIYSVDTEGNKILFAFSNTKAKLSVSAPPTTNLSSPAYPIVVYGVPQNAQKVEFSTWTERNGKDDLRTVLGKKISNGVWKTTVPFYPHKNETGKYLTDIFVNGTKMAESITEVVPSTATVRAPESISIYKVASYDIYVDGLSPDIKRVSFPTWTEYDGTDDIVYSEGIKVSDTSWKVTVTFKDHRYERGIYVTNVNVFDEDGNMGTIFERVKVKVTSD